MAPETKSAQGLAEWYRSERRKQVGRSGSSLRICQCSTETFISTCENPPLMRAFLFVAASIDEAMRTEYRWPNRKSSRLGAPETSIRNYEEFRERFALPKLEAHGMGADEFVSPDWVVDDHFGWDRLMDWQLCAIVADTLIVSVRNWIGTRPNAPETEARICQQLQWLLSRFERYDPQAAVRVNAALT